MDAESSSDIKDTPAPVAAPPSSPKRRPIRGWRLWLFRLTALLLIPTLLLGLVEIGLRVCGYGYPTSFFVKAEKAKGKERYFIENHEFGRRFFPPGLMQKPLPMTVPLVKEKGVYRVFVLGESAAQGFPDPSSSFARLLEVLLRAAYPDMRFEIVNTAMVAINSHAVLPIARECAGHEPDLFIVHLGNNEVVGTFGTAGVLGANAVSNRLIRTNLLVKRTRVGQLYHRVIQGLSPSRSPASWDGMAMFVNSRIRASDPRLEGTRDGFRRNLVDICRAGSQAGAQVLVCTIPVNLRECAPFGSLHSAALTDAQTAQWEERYEAGRRCEEAGQPTEALRHYEEAAVLDDEFADLHYRKARCLAQLKKNAEAEQCFRRACDLDVLRFRSDTQINATIRDVVGSLADERVKLVDAVGAFAAASETGVPGEELFLEHVHMNFAGNYLLARTLFDKIAPLVASRSRAPQPLSEQECAARLAYTAWNRLQVEARIAQMVREAPFTQQLDRVERDQRLHERLDKLRRLAGAEAEVKQAVTQFQQALERTPEDWWTRQNFARFLIQAGVVERGIEEYQIVLRQLPHYSDGFRELGKTQLQIGNLTAAKRCFETALQLDPETALTHYDLATVLAVQGKVEEGIAVFARRANRERNRAEALALLANFLLQQGRSAEARQQLDQALQHNAEEPTVHLIFGHLLAKEGVVQEAIAHYETATRLRPSLAAQTTPLIEKLNKDKRAE